MSDYFFIFIVKINFIMATYVTKEGLEKMKAELEHLESVRDLK